MLMILPAPANAEVSLRRPLVAEAQLLHQTERWTVPRDDVGLDPVKGEIVESESESERQSLGHVTVPCVHITDPIADIAGLEPATDDIA
jgi:hypothetical protein